MPSQEALPSSKTEKPMYLPRIENNTIEENMIKVGRTFFKLKKKIEAIKGKIITDFRTFLHQKNIDYSKTVTIRNEFLNNYVEYERNGDKNKTLSIKEYLRERHWRKACDALKEW